MVSHKLILASASPRRKELLSQIGISPDIISPSDIDETPKKQERPLQYARRIALGKAEKCALSNAGHFVLSADTVVACGIRILPKAENNEDVRKCLELLSGRQHNVITAVVVISPMGKISCRDVVTKVTFKKLSAVEINDYISSDEGIGKAGGYAIQGLAGSFVKNINGSYSSVVGLPLYEVKNMLNGLGYAN